MVDDNPSIHDDFRRIFTLSPVQASGLDELAESMFGIAGVPAANTFSLDHVTQGRDALERIRAAQRADRPYALVFMDVRMPPGWDGVETCTHIIGTDADVHVVLCTAYPERGWRDRVDVIPGRDRILILKKPFDIVEIQQLANALCERWTHSRRERDRMRDLERSVTEQKGRLAAAANHLRNEIASRTIAEGRLRKARKLEGLGRLAAGMCHEINNPLSFIMANAELIGSELEELGDRIPAAEYEELNELVHTISIGASRITRIVRNIKMFARNGEEASEYVDLQLTIDSALGMLQTPRPSHVQLRVERCDAAVRGRRFELEQVLINLVENALHALDDQREPPGIITIATRAANTSVSVDIRDNGPGIDESILAEIFDPFFTTKSVGKGTGLGLSICSSLITGMQGTLEARNNPERGATFTITLPSAPSTDAARPDAPRTPSRSPLTRLGRVLVVDDEPLVLDMLERVLQPHAVTTALTVQDALAHCGAEAFDLVLCDILMPGLDGRDFHRMLARLRPGAEDSIVFVTGGTLHDEVRAFLQKVPNHFIEKPFESQELRALVNEHVQRRSAPT